MSDFIVRRLRLDELDEIAKIQANVGFLRHYPMHENWLDAAIDDIAKGQGRIAFGAFRLKRTKNGSDDCFVGSVILTQPKFSNTGAVKVKNLIVSTEKVKEATHLLKEDEIYKQIQTAKELLLKRVVRFARSRGFRELHVEIPTAHLKELSFYVNQEQKFSVVNTQQNRYIPGDSVYQLKRSLPPIYRSDPFDSHAIAKWVVGCYFRQENVLDTPEHARRPRYRKFEFEIPADSAMEVESGDMFKACWVIDDGISQDSPNKNEISKLLDDVKFNADLSAFLTVRELNNITSVVRKDGTPIRCIGRDWLRRCTGAWSTVNTCKLRLNDCVGTLLELHPSCAAKLRASAKEKQTLVFYVPNGIGASVWKHRGEFCERSALIYSPSGGPGDYGTSQGIWAIADIQGISTDSYNEARERARNGEAVMPLNDFDYYLNTFHAHYEFRGEDFFPGLKLSNFVVFRNAIPIEEVLSENVLSSLDTGETFGDEQKEVTACYVDQESLDNAALFEKGNKPGVEVWQPEIQRVFVSYRTGATSYLVNDMIGHLRDAFPDLFVFLDSEQISPGQFIRDKIISGINDSDMVLFFIDKYWRLPNKDGVEEIEKLDDYIRIEVEAALNCHRKKEIKILPLFVNGADSTSLGNSPAAIKKLRDIRAEKLPNQPEMAKAKLGELVAQHLNSMAAKNKGNSFVNSP